MCQSFFDGRGVPAAEVLRGVARHKAWVLQSFFAECYDSQPVACFMVAEAPEKRILFVCAGNLCRSFMAERIFRTRLRQRALPYVRVESAGLLDLGGADPDPQAAALLRQKGFDSSMHRSRTLTEDLVAGSDLIVVMERDQMREITKRYPDAAEKVRLLKSFSSNAVPADLDIEDPHGRSSYHYRSCFNDIYFSLEGLLQCI